MFYLVLDYLPVPFLCLHGHCFVSWLSHHQSIEILLKASQSCSSVSLPHWCYRTVSQTLRPIRVKLVSNHMMASSQLQYKFCTLHATSCLFLITACLLYSHTTSPLLRLPTRLLPRRVSPKQDIYFPHISHFSYTLCLFQQLVPIPEHLDHFFSGGRHVTSDAFLD